MTVTISLVVLGFLMFTAATDSPRPISTSASIVPEKTLAQAVITAAYTESYHQESVGKYTEAIRALAEVYQVYGKTYTVNFRLGWLFYLNHNYKDALAALDRALMVVPTSVEVMNVVVLVYVAQQDWKKVEEQSIKTLKIDYYNFTANYWYAFALRMQEKFDLSAQVCRKMLTIMPTSIAFLQELGESLFLSGEKKESHSVFESIIVLDPNNETAKIYLKKY